MFKIILFAILLFPQILNADWFPPANPNPKLILNEARKDFDSKNYQDALEKNIWFHNNALKYNQALSGVRLSFALSDWIRLSEEYSPALVALKSIRDEKEITIKSRNQNIYSLFNDITAINEKLSVEDRTSDLFLWLDKNQQAKANKVFRLAKPSLIKAKQYHLCGKYIKPQKDFYISTQGFKDFKSYAEKRKNQEVKDFAYKKFSNEVSILIAILVQNNRKQEAEEIIKKALTVWNNPVFKQQLNGVLSGNLPETWP